MYKKRQCSHWRVKQPKRLSVFICRGSTKAEEGYWFVVFHANSPWGYLLFNWSDRLTNSTFWRSGVKIFFSNQSLSSSGWNFLFGWFEVKACPFGTPFVRLTWEKKGSSPIWLRVLPVFRLIGSPIQLCFLSMCLPTDQCLLPCLSSGQFGQTQFIGRIPFQSVGWQCEHRCNTGATSVIVAWDSNTTLTLFNKIVIERFYT